MFASQDLIPWFADFSNYLASNIVPSDLSFHQRKKFMYDVKKFFWDEPYLYNSCSDGLIRRCVQECVMLSVLEACHSSPVGGHHSGIRIKRYFNVVTIGQLFIKMLMGLLKHVTNVNEMVVFQESKSSL